MENITEIFVLVDDTLGLLPRVSRPKLPKTAWTCASPIVSLPPSFSCPTSPASPASSGFYCHYACKHLRAERLWTREMAVHKIDKAAISLRIKPVEHE